MAKKGQKTAICQSQTMITSLIIRMQHCRIKATDGIEFWINCKWPAFFSDFSLLQGIQNKRPWCSNAAYVTAG